MATLLTRPDICGPLVSGLTGSHCTRKSQKTSQTCPVWWFNWLKDCYNNERTSLNLHWLGLGGQTMKNLRRLACKFDLNQSEHKSWQVNASARKPRPNGVASRPMFSTCVYLRLRLPRPYVLLRWLAMTYAHFGPHQIFTQVDVRFSSFAHPTQVSASWVTFIQRCNKLLASEIQRMSAWWLHCGGAELSLRLSFVATCVYLLYQP